MARFSSLRVPDAADNEPNLAPDGHTLYFSSDRTLPLRFPRTRARADADLARIDAWDNGNANVWSISFVHASHARA